MNNLYSAFLRNVLSAYVSVLVLLGLFAPLQPVLASEPLTTGTFTNKDGQAIICFNSGEQLKQVADLRPAKAGCGEHHYLIVRVGYDETQQMVPLDTLGMTADEAEMLAWYTNHWIIGDSVGEFALRAFVHDDCSSEWLPCNGEVAYRVLSAFNPGKIQVPEFGRDTVYLKNGQVRVSVRSLEPASGASGEYVYEWLRGVRKIGFEENLTNYRITTPGYIRLRRNVKDVGGCGVAVSEGVYQLKVFEELLPGAIEVREDLEYCTIERAAADIITATPASGGSLTYLYQWFIESGDELMPIAGATDCNLPLNKVPLVAGEEYTFVRKVKDNTRFTDWLLTTNRQTIRMVGKPEVRICESEACACNRAITFYYELLAGEVDMYAIMFSPKLAAVLGHTDTLVFIGEPRVPGTITVNNLLPLPADLPADEYYMDIKLGASCAAKSLDEVDCYSAVTRVAIVNGLDGYVREKFERMLVVDNNPDNTLHFADFSWYKNGRPVGKGEQFYQEADGSKLDGSYFVRLHDQSGKSYRSCSVLKLQEQQTSLGQLQADGLMVYPVPVEPGKPVTVYSSRAVMTVYACTGEQVMSLTTADGRTTFAAPRMSGVYYIRLRHEDGSMLTGKLIVK